MILFSMIFVLLIRSSVSIFQQEGTEVTEEKRGRAECVFRRL